MRKEDIFKQLDSFSDRGGDIMKAEFIAHLCNIVALTEREAIPHNRIYQTMRKTRTQPLLIKPRKGLFCIF